MELRANGLVFSALSEGEGPAVLCLHGFPDHARTFESLLHALAQGGFWGLAPTMRGYESSSRAPDGGYDVPALASDLVGWLDALGLEAAHIVGHDWGAVVASYLAQTAPERVRSLAVLAIPWLGLPLRRLLHPAQLRRSWYMAFFQLRGFAETRARADDFALIRRLWRDWSPGFELEPPAWNALRDALAVPGVLEATLGYYRCAFALGSRRTRRWLARRRAPVRVPTLALTGARDGCIGTRLFDDWPASAFPEGLRVERLADAGHFLHLERPERVNTLLLDWLDERCSAGRT